jgi:hypothetical protein
LSQTKFNLVCRDFTFEQEVSSRGKNLRNVFEIAISKSNYPFKVLEREKMDKIFETLQEEKNLVKDLSNEWKKKLQMANVDYLVVGDLNENIAMDNYDLVINFIKITGENMTVKLPMLISLSRKQISNNEELKMIFDREIQTFLKSYFLDEKNDSNLIEVPKFYEELKKRDSMISNLNTSVSFLQNQNSIKDNEIMKLKQDVTNIKDYINIARLDVYGLEFHVSPPLIQGQTPLSRLMKNVLERKGNEINLKMTDSSLFYINQVIKEFPNFPFGYWAKAKKELTGAIENALKAVEIFEITTSIDGHKADHDQALADLKNNILKPLGIEK